jgi:hypothetical protein
MSIAAEDRQAIREVYGRSCGYCGISESDIGGELEIDHYRPITKGGDAQRGNLVYACVHCNRFKGNYWPETNDPESFYILHPGEDDLSIHLRITANGRIEGLTPRGWFHIHRLHLNRPQLVLWRQNWHRLRELEEALRHSEEVTNQLRQRIRELEHEASVLRQRIARITGQER